MSSKEKRSKNRSSSLKNRENGKKKTKEEEKKVKTAQPQEYEDDFEDFEDDNELKKKENGRLPSTSYEDDFEDEEAVSNKQTPSSSSTTPAPRETQPRETSLVEDQTSQIAKRIASRQSQQNTNYAVPQKFDRSLTLNSETTTSGVDARGQERFSMLKSLINIEICRSVVLDDTSLSLERLQATASNELHAFSQTALEGFSEEAQTEVPPTEDASTQCPAYEPAAVSSSAIDRSRLQKFLFAAGQVMEEMLGRADAEREDEMQEKSELHFSMGFNVVQLGAIAKKSKATAVYKGDGDTIFAAFEIFESLAQDLANHGLIVEFIVQGGKPPVRLFVTQDAAMSMTKSSTLSALFVALRDGTFCAFDLLAADSTFDDSLPWAESNEDIVLRRPTFDSSFLAPTIADASPLVAIQVSQHSGGEEVCTLDARGTLSFWLVARQNEELSLQLSAVIRPHPSLLRNASSFIVNCMCTVLRPLRFFIGTDTGGLYSISRTDASNVGPRTYRTNAEMHGEVTCMAISPFVGSLILVGLSTGKLAIYRIGSQSPLLFLGKEGNGRCVTAVQWSLVSSTVFYSFHASKTIQYWDLVQGANPLYTDVHDEKRGNITHTCSWKNDSESAGSGICYMALATDQGTVEVHALESFNKKETVNESITAVLKRHQHF